jgi:aquaporin Z
VDIVKKYLAEFIGTFTLVFLGCGAVVAAHHVLGADQQIGIVGIALAFGFALIAMAYGIGPISGCHINPAVSLGVFVAGRMKGKDLAGYVVAQFLGGIVAGLVLYLMLKSDPRVSALGANGWGAGYGGGYGVGPAIAFELIATFIFLVVILGSTQKGAPTQVAGLAIGIALIAIHLFGVTITGASVNPARSFGPALFSLAFSATPLKQVWLFVVVPSVGGVLAGFLFRHKALEA